MLITEFLEARIAEDEAAANAAAISRNDQGHMEVTAGHHWMASGGLVCNAELDPEVEDAALWDCEGSDTLCMAPAAAAHVALHDPARALAECAAKRAIIAAHKNQEDNDDDMAWIVASEVLLHALAAVYADHPDYLPEWKP